MKMLKWADRSYLGGPNLCVGIRERGREKESEGAHNAFNDYHIFTFKFKYSL